VPQAIFCFTRVFVDFNLLKLMICVLAFIFMIQSICQSHVYIKNVINFLGWKV